MFESNWEYVTTMVIVHIQEYYAPLLIGMHYMANWTNLTIQTFFLPMVTWLQDLLQSLCYFFYKFWNCHLEFVKLAQIMQTKGNNEQPFVSMIWATLTNSKWHLKNLNRLLKFKIMDWSVDWNDKRFILIFLQNYL